VGIVVDMGRIVSAYERLASDPDIVVVEGAGDWLSDALLSAQAIARSGAQLAGWIGSAIDPAMPAQIENVEAFEQRLPAPQLGLLPGASSRPVRLP
jgi:dethiobiotin synthetase